MRAELDHLLLFVPNEAAARSMFKNAGLTANYSRVHLGQGTTNLCACLDDVFLELLWLNGSALSAESERITLGGRGRGTGSPIGVAWRGDSDLECEPYAAPFLPNGVTIPVARASLQGDLPFVFQSPGGVAPMLRTDGLCGERQRPSFATLGACEIVMPNATAASSLVRELSKLTLREGHTALHLTLLNPQGQIAHKITWRAPFPHGWISASTP